MKDAKELLDRYKTGLCTPEEIELLQKWFHQIGVEEPSKLTDKELIEARKKFNIHLQNLIHKGKTHKVWYRIAAVASILVVLSIGLHFLILKNKQQSDPLVATKNNVKPGMNGAILTLSNGQKVVLEQIKTGKIASGIQKSNDNLLVYTNTETVGYNTLETPKGRQYSVVLPDGSKVWLNAASSLKYPTRFTGAERLVKLTGEAYFEVVHNDKMPFAVATPHSVVKDLGTHFNIDAYSDTVEKTTLLEGSIAVHAATGPQVLLKPGEQVAVTGNVLHVKHIDVDGVVAWKNGLFVFDRTRLSDAMQQLARWYNVEIRYTDNAVKDQVLIASVSRFKNISEVLALLESTGKVRFEQNENIVTVKSR